MDLVHLILHICNQKFSTLQISQLRFIVAIDCVELLLFIFKGIFFSYLLKYDSDGNAKV